MAPCPPVSAECGRLATATRSIGTTSIASRRARQRRVGRHQRPAVRRAQRDRRLSGDRRGGQHRHSGALGDAAGTAVRGGRDPLPRTRPRPIRRRRSSDSALLRPLHARRRRRRARAGSGSRDRLRRRHTRSAGSRCSSCRRTHARAAADFRSRLRRGRTRRSGSRSTRGANRPAGTYRGAHHGDRRRPPAGACPWSLELFDFALARREQHARDDVLLERSARALSRPQPGRRVPSLRASPTDRAGARLRRRECDAPLSGGSPARDFTRDAHYEGPGRITGNVIVPASFYGPGTRLRRSRQRLVACRCVDDVPQRSLPNALTFLYMPDEPRPPQYPRILRLADNVHSNPGPGRALPVFVTHEYVDALAPAIDIWCSGPAGLRHRARAAGACARARVLVLQRRPAGRRRDHHRCAGDRRARDDLGRVQARRARVLLLARRALAPQLAEAGRAQPERVGRQHHLRQSRPAEQADRRPGLHPRRRRAALSRRREAAPGPGPRHPGSDLDDAARQLPPRAPGSSVPRRSRGGSGSPRSWTTSSREIVPRVFSDAGTTVSFPERWRSVRGGTVEAGARDRCRPPRGRSRAPDLRQPVLFDTPEADASCARCRYSRPTIPGTRTSRHGRSTRSPPRLWRPSARTSRSGSTST